MGGGYVWVLMVGGGRRVWLYQVDPATMTFVGAPIAVGTVSSYEAFRCSVSAAADFPSCSVAAGEGAIWVAHSGGLWRVDALGQRPVTTIPVPMRSVSAGEGAVWAVSRDAVHSIDPRTAEVIATAKKVGATIPMGERPRGLAFGHGSVWVQRSDDVVRVDPRTNEIVASILLCVRGGYQLVQGVVVGLQAVWVSRSELLCQIDPATSQAQPEQHLNPLTTGHGHGHGQPSAGR